MSKDNKFVEEALSDIDKVADSEDSALKIELDDELVQSAKKLQKALHLSKDVFFNVVASYGAYCCSKSDFDESELPKGISGKIIIFNVSVESETVLEEHSKYSKELITVFGLIKMSKKLL